MSQDLPYRKSFRLFGFDYSSPVWYYVTICTQDRRCLFGKIVDGKLLLNIRGQMVNKWWNKLSNKYDFVDLDQFIIMPNHIHGIIRLVGAIPCNRPPNYVNNRPHDCTGENVVSPLRITNTYNGLGQIISWFKRMSTNEYIHNVNHADWPPFNHKLWQRNYYEHIIRNQSDLFRIRRYITQNPSNWKQDKLFLNQT